MQYNACKYFALFILLLFLSCSKQQHREGVGLLDECSVIAAKNITAIGDTVVVCDNSMH